MMICFKAYSEKEQRARKEINDYINKVVLKNIIPIRIEEPLEIKQHKVMMEILSYMQIPKEEAGRINEEELAAQLLLADARRKNDGFMFNECSDKFRKLSETYNKKGLFNLSAKASGTARTCSENASILESEAEQH